MKDALAELESWTRKYYRFEITSNGSIQPGDGLQVVLIGGGRKVTVDEEDLIERDGNGDATIYPGIGDVILEAIRRWHADDTPKKYLAYWLHQEKYPEFTPAPDVQWQWWTKYMHSEGMIQASFQARNEQEAIQKVKDGYKGTEIGKVTVYERA